MRKADAVNLLAERLAQRAVALRDANAMPDDRWLLDLHRDYVARFLAENNRIWTMGAIFVAISFAGLAGVPDNSLAVGVTGIASVALMFIWNLTADRHRAFQDDALLWVDAIEEYLTRKGDLNLPIRPAPFRAQALRWILLALVGVVWAVRFIGTVPAGH